MTKKLQMVYEPGGRAREYSPWALNHYKHCPHGCVYCYVEDALHLQTGTFTGDAVPKDLTRAWADIKRLAGKQEPIFLSFACDPYPMGCDCSLTRKVIEECNKWVVPYRILTKNGTDSLRDLALYKTNCEFGLTLTFTEVGDSARWEPGASLPLIRWKALEAAHEAGIFTWASIEPVIFAQQSLDNIEATLDIVDHFKIGKLNHMKPPIPIDWPAFRENAIDMLKRNGFTETTECDRQPIKKSYYIKKDLKEARN